MDVDLTKRVWWEYLHEDLRELFGEAVLISEKVRAWNERFHDYSFIVFPAAKAYEGFLKTLFLDMGFITKDDYYGKRFRIGRALNPSLEQYLRKEESVYDRIVKFCGGNELADRLWETWKESRNLLFHWFPEERNAITNDEAVSKLNLIFDTMDVAFKECKINRGHAQ
ncbi:type II toxin-antitoxin system RnlA family toxin [Candidatus Woesebacteria bacterium]|nr:type II toxin-antitoxin system RnlA family toxin [Candidatus Woesebacteria bacterium]